jgi:hypothetical protein
MERLLACCKSTDAVLEGSGCHGGRKFGIVFFCARGRHISARSLHCSFCYTWIEADCSSLVPRLRRRRSAFSSPTVMTCLTKCCGFYNLVVDISPQSVLYRKTDSLYLEEKFGRAKFQSGVGMFILVFRIVSVHCSKIIFHCLFQQLHGN